ncbi:MAG: Coenzyme F420 hydrogenase/dehydrogenase, beta subunit C-terminal domain [Candidatus Hodarchaeales archaeon]
MLSRLLELENEVWNLDRCTGCGMCVAACSRGRLEFKSDMPHPSFISKVKTVGLSVVDIDTCSFCEGMCAESCPRLKEWEVSEMINVISAKTTRIATSNHINEIVTDLLSAGFANGFIDAALITDVNRWDGTPYPRVVRSIEELYEVSGNQRLWNPILSNLYHEVLNNDFNQIAIVGPPCVAQAIRRVNDSKLEGLAILQKSIGIVIGLFCSGYYETALLEDLSSHLGVSPAEIISITGSANGDSLEIKLTTGKIATFPLEEKQKYLRKGCARCIDYVAEMADISVGQTGSQVGYATLIPWNMKGQGFLSNCLNLGLLEATEEVDLNMISTACSEKQRRERIQTFDSLLIYSLESLTDENRLTDAKNRFMDLFIQKKSSKSLKMRGGCNGCSGC